MTPTKQAKTYRCPECGHESKRVDAYKRHYLSLHVDPREARHYATMAEECPTCGAEPLEPCVMRDGMPTLGTATHFRRNPRNRPS